MMADNIDLNRGMRCIKYILFSFNFIFMLTGMLIIAVGTTILTTFQRYDHFLEDSFYSPAKLLIVIGVAIGIIAFFGCFGAARESTCLIMVFSVLLAIVFILEVSAGIAAYVLQDGLKDILDSKMSYLMKQYPYDTDVAATFDFVQEKLHCCGLYNIQDWKNYLNATESTIDFNNLVLPASCCANFVPDADNLTALCSMVYGNGCVANVEFILSESAVMLASAAFTLALLQLLGVMFACSLGRSIRYQKTARERRRWELREQLLNSYTPLGQTDPKTTYPTIFMYGSHNKEADC